ncbi:hypothetical protein H310_15018 [Aphanomyces invadans]|uniref:FYVE-type domain-containing protein n=1 Tax=Aphanomyces invadans TaxID=157072 RepID=A0A024T7Y4_9STRA|nr:hypothetical protein H310_15018 [Aphanomyces invadans]ETV90150.1 hypothetical protein H310_15018 [Aphanomyces invadans]|eukprot:XP_008881220.1 hypothetical protein H310_15018 [Aphanomyces invadans]
MPWPLKQTKADMPTVHRRQDELVQTGVDTLDAILARDSGQDGTVWTAGTTLRRRQESSSVMFWKGHVPGYTVDAVKATCYVGCSAVQLANKLKDPTRLREYDATIFGCRIVEEVDVPSFTTIQFWQGVPLFPATAREFCVLTAERRLPGSQEIVLAARSIEHESVPHNAAYIRGEMYLTGFILRPVGKTSCFVTALRHVNMCGTAAPFVGRKADDMVAIAMNLQRLFGKPTEPNDLPVTAVAPVSSLQRPAPHEPPPDASTCANCGKDISHGFSRHRCIVCHHVLCGDCARHVVKSKQWQVLRMCNPCAAENVANDQRTPPDKSPVRVQRTTEEIAAQPASQVSPTALLVVCAVASLVVWMEWPGHALVIFTVGLLSLFASIAHSPSGCASSRGELVRSR